MKPVEEIAREIVENGSTPPVMQDEIATALRAEWERAERAENYAREATKTLTRLAGGGSELFTTTRNGDEVVYLADLPVCESRIRERLERGFKAISDNVSCNRTLAASREAAESALATARNRALEEAAEEIRPKSNRALWGGFESAFDRAADRILSLRTPEASNG